MNLNHLCSNGTLKQSSLWLPLKIFLATFWRFPLTSFFLLFKLVLKDAFLKSTVSVWFIIIIITCVIFNYRWFLVSSFTNIFEIGLPLSENFNSKFMFFLQVIFTWLSWIVEATGCHCEGYKTCMYRYHY